MQSIPAQTTEQLLQDDNANGNAIIPLMNITTNNEGTIAFVPTRHELSQLVKHWAGEAISDEFMIFWSQCCCGSDLQEIDKYWGRVSAIAKILGNHETEKAISEAYEEAAQRGDANDWIVFRYGTSEEARDYEDKGGQCFLDFEPGAAEEIASKVIERVFREGSPAEQEALLKEELRRCAGKLKADYPHHVIKLFGIFFPAFLKPRVLSAGIADPNPGNNINTFFEGLTIEQGKAILAVLKKAATHGSAEDV
jgi:hypothetical protein